MAAADGLQVYPSFHWPVRVYYEDTDAGGVVYHSNYLKFMERARTERIRSVGFELDELVRDHGILFVVRSMAIDFKKPAHFNESLSVSADFKDLRPASIVFHQVVTRGGSEILAEAEVKVASVNASTFRPMGVPECVLERLTAAPKAVGLG